MSYEESDSENDIEPRRDYIGDADDSSDEEDMAFSQSDILESLNLSLENYSNHCNRTEEGTRKLDQDKAIFITHFFGRALLSSEKVQKLYYQLKRKHLNGSKLPDDEIVQQWISNALKKTLLDFFDLGDLKLSDSLTINFLEFSGEDIIQKFFDIREYLLKPIYGGKPRQDKSIPLFQELKQQLKIYVNGPTVENLLTNNEFNTALPFTILDLASDDCVISEFCSNGKLEQYINEGSAYYENVKGLTRKQGCSKIISRKKTDKIDGLISKESDEFKKCYLQIARPSSRTTSQSGD